MQTKLPTLKLRDPMEYGTYNFLTHGANTILWNFDELHPETE